MTGFRCGSTKRRHRVNRETSVRRTAAKSGLLAAVMLAGSYTPTVSAQPGTPTTRPARQDPAPSQSERGPRDQPLSLQEPAQDAAEAHERHETREDLDDFFNIRQAN